ncbi:hypothetical protein LXL04_004212 [Taraxacum kok-saghyz]
MSSVIRQFALISVHYLVQIFIIPHVQLIKVINFLLVPIRFIYATQPLQLIYSDVWGPVKKSFDGFAYYVVFVDYFSKYIWLYPIKHKSDVSKIFPQYKLLVEKFFQKPIISMFTDNGGEYQALIPLFQSMRISHYTTPPHTPEQNGIAERRHRHIVETGLALLHFAGLPLSFWSHAFQTAVHIINRLPTPILNSKCSFEILYDRSPNYTKLQPFGCPCYPWLRSYSPSKLYPRSSLCLFLGYSSDKAAYKCYHLDTRRVYHSRHVEFVPRQYPYKDSPHTDPALPSVDEFFILTPLPTSALPIPLPTGPLPVPLPTRSNPTMDFHIPPPPTDPTTHAPTLDSHPSPVPQQPSPPTPTAPSPSPTPSPPRLTRHRKPNPK